MFAELTPTAWPARRLPTDLALAFGLYALLAWVCIEVGRQPGTIAVVWLANGMAAGLMVSAPRQHRLPMLGMVLAGNLAANLAYGDPLPVSLAFMLPNAAEVALAVLLMQRTRIDHRFAESARDFLRTVVAGSLLPPLASATAGAALLHLLGFGRFERVWLDWYLGAATGSLALLPLVLELRTARPWQRWRRLVRPVPALALLLVGPATLLALHLLPYPFAATLLLLTATAVALPRQATLLAVPLMLVFIMFSLAFGYLQPVVADNPLGHSAFFLALLMAVLPAQLCAVVVARQRALDGLLQALGGRSNEIVLLCDTQRVLRWASKARETFTGTPNEQVLGRTVENLAAAGLMRAAAPELHIRALAGEEVVELHEADYAALGRRTMRVHIQPVRDDDGIVVGTLSVASDVTELEQKRRQLEALAAQLKASNDGLEQFVRIASHDLREPMNTVQQFVQLLQDGPARTLGEPATQWFEQVRQGAVRMKLLLDDLLLYVRLDAGSDASLPDNGPVQAVDLDALLAETLQALHAQHERVGAVVRTAPLGSVPGRPGLLALMLQNLVSNALKFSRPGVPPELALSAHRDGSELHLSVADNGVGIPAERLAELGQPFKRLHSRRRYEGTGLGLAIVRGILARHGGRLLIESVEGQGSRFTAVLPLGPDRAEGPPE